MRACVLSIYGLVLLGLLLLSTNLLAVPGYPNAGLFSFYSMLLQILDLYAVSLRYSHSFFSFVESIAVPYFAIIIL